MATIVFVLARAALPKLDQISVFRGSKSRNKAVVGEPATGSLPLKHLFACCFVCLVVVWGVCVFFTHSLTAAANEQQQQQKIGLVSMHINVCVWEQPTFCAMGSVCI